MSLHKNLIGANLHALAAFSYANAGDRTAAAGLVAADVGKLAWQTDNDTFWVLKTHSPIEWVPVAPAGAGSGDMLKSENLSGLADYPTARTNLGLGSAATTASGDYDVAGAAAAAQAAAVQRANHTGTQLASTISDFATAVAATAEVTANTAKVTYPAADSSKLAGIAAGAQVNTGTIVGVTGTIAEFNTALTDGNFATGGGTATGANSDDNAANSTYASDYRAANFVAGTDYLAPAGSAAALTSFPTLNQNTSGTAAGLSSTLVVGSGGTGTNTLTAKGILFGNGTAAVGITAAGTATHVLTSNGAGNDPTFQAAAGGGGIHLSRTIRRARQFIFA